MCNNCNNSWPGLLNLFNRNNNGCGSNRGCSCSGNRNNGCGCNRGCGCSGNGSVGFSGILSPLNSNNYDPYYADQYALGNNSNGSSCNSCGCNSCNSCGCNSCNSCGCSSCNSFNVTASFSGWDNVNF